MRTRRRVARGTYLSCVEKSSLVSSSSHDSSHRCCVAPLLAASVSSACQSVCGVCLGLAIVAARGWWGVGEAAPSTGKSSNSSSSSSAAAFFSAVAGCSGLASEAVLSSFLVGGCVEAIVVEVVWLVLAVVEGGEGGCLGLGECRGRQPTAASDQAICVLLGLRVVENIGGRRGQEFGYVWSCRGGCENGRR
ncbi:hypothetical protein BT67DRAFT_300528 [Trichocladium antarcticum]|uniref:Uncharacterized protein n=1 Tax=Trichocladium antarcticum TaxID=1450529 RepID=A0AAN6UKK8_9PEZI|nr:hypothetical protein BT67DRAFT_300528 [Trichocladium antarcticum]